MNTETLTYPPKTLAEIEADPFLKECVKITATEGAQGPEHCITIALTAEIRIPKSVLAGEGVSEADMSAQIASMVKERYNFDLDFDVWPTLTTRIEQALNADAVQSSAKENGNG